MVIYATYYLNSTKHSTLTWELVYNPFQTSIPKVLENNGAKGPVGRPDPDRQTDSGQSNRHCGGRQAADKGSGDRCSNPKGQHNIKKKEQNLEKYQGLKEELDKMATVLLIGAVGTATHQPERVALVDSMNNIKDLCPEEHSLRTS